MSSISETNYGSFLSKKPYLTKIELSMLLGKRGKNLDKKVLQMFKKKELLPLKKGLYIDPSYLAFHKGKVEEYVANILYFPSYLSLEYVLAKEGLIPEAVYTYTSVTTKATRMFSNALGTFVYRSVKPEFFDGYVSIRFQENYRIKTATKAKALFDFLYLRPLTSFEDLRIHWEIFTKDDQSEFMQYVTSSDSRKMKVIADQMKRRVS